MQTVCQTRTKTQKVVPEKNYTRQLIQERNYFGRQFRKAQLKTYRSLLKNNT
jgi:hypothetical protein